MGSKVVAVGMHFDAIWNWGILISEPALLENAN